MAMGGVIGQYFIDISIDGSGDFLGRNGQLNSFVMEQRIGGELPVFSLTFNTLDKTIMKKLNEGTKVFIRFGKTWAEADQAVFMIQKFSFNTSKDQLFVEVHIEGFVYGGAEYLREEKQKSWRFKTSKEVIIDTITDYWDLYDTAEETDDEQIWIRASTPALGFVFKTWRDSYISDDNFLILALRFNRSFDLTDLKTVMGQGVKWKLIPDYRGSSTRICSFEADVKTTSDFGLINQMTAYTKVKPMHNSIHASDSKQETPDQGDTTFTEGTMNMSANAKSKTENQVIYDHTNQHKNKHKARYNNMAKQALTNSVELVINTESKWQSYQLLDLIEYTPFTTADQIDNSGTAGIYVITRISRFYGKQRACTEITISRDGISGMEGSGFSTMLDLF